MWGCLALPPRARHYAAATRQRDARPATPARPRPRRRASGQACRRGGRSPRPAHTPSGASCRARRRAPARRVAARRKRCARGSHVLVLSASQHPERQHESDHAQVQAEQACHSRWSSESCSANEARGVSRAVAFLSASGGTISAAIDEHAGFHQLGQLVEDAPLVGELGRGRLAPPPPRAAPENVQGRPLR